MDDDRVAVRRVAQRIGQRGCAELHKRALHSCECCEHDDGFHDAHVISVPCEALKRRRRSLLSPPLPMALGPASPAL